MQEIASEKEPDMTIFAWIVPSSAADQVRASQHGGRRRRHHDQARRHAKGGGAISAVSETKAPILSIGTANTSPDGTLRDNDLVALFGMGDIMIVEKMSEVVPEESFWRSF